jgi:putative ABC transport system permease protein
LRTLASFREAFALAAASLNSSKLRSFLTLLGVILATTTLIVVMSMVHGMDVYVAEQVSDMGTDGFRVQRIPMLGEFDPKKFIELEKRNPKLNLEEYGFLKNTLTLVKDLGVEADQSVSVHYRADGLDAVNLMGGTPNLAAMSSIEIANGRFFAAFEDERHMNVACIGDDLRDRFFRDRDPVGKTILVNQIPFEVIGVAKKRGSAFGQSRDDFLIIPIHTFLKNFGVRPELEFTAVAIDHARLNDAEDETRALLRAYRRLRPNQDDNFGLLASDSLVGLWDKLTGVLATMALGIVSIFMVVGGVVIMNIMLAVVSERTFEIGIRKAIGATRQDIQLQFLIESALLAASGGAIGVIIAWLMAVAVRSATPMPMAVPASAVFVGVGLSAIVGLFFGVYPARRAALLDPVQALRWER